MEYRVSHIVPTTHILLMENKHRKLNSCKLTSGGGSRANCPPPPVGLHSDKVIIGSVVHAAELN